jgi:DNA-binding phage protein
MNREDAAWEYIDALFDAMRERNVGKAYVAHNSGVSKSTLRKWELRQVRSPHLITVRFALRAVGYDIKVVRTNR